MNARCSKLLFTSLALVLSLFCGTGCVHEPIPQQNWSDVSNAPPPRSLTADQVNAQNAHAQTAALRAEMDAER